MTSSVEQPTANTDLSRSRPRRPTREFIDDVAKVFCLVVVTQFVVIPLGASVGAIVALPCLCAILVVLVRTKRVDADDGSVAARGEGWDLLDKAAKLFCFFLALIVPGGAGCLFLLLIALIAYAGFSGVASGRSRRDNFIG